MTKTERKLMDIARASSRSLVHISHGVDCGSTGLARSRQYGDRSLNAIRALIARGELVEVRHTNDRLSHGIQFTLVARLPS